MDEPQITIAIPFRGCWRLLRSAVESVIGQTTPHWRVVVCDNGSLDEEDVEARLLDYDDARIAYVRNPRDLGIVGNFNRCLEAAETDLVVLLHADDRLMPNYCEAMLGACAGRPDAVAHYCQPQAINVRDEPCFSTREVVKRFFAPARKKKVAILRGEAAAAALLRGYHVCSPSMCFRKSVLDGRRFDPAWGQVMDIELNVRLLMDGETIAGLPARLYCYRRHTGQTTAQNIQNLSFFQEHVRLYDLLHGKAATMGWRELAAVARRKRIVKMQLCYWALVDLSHADLRHFWKKARFLARGGQANRGMAEERSPPSAIAEEAS